MTSVSKSLCLEHLLALILGVEQESLVVVAVVELVMMADRYSSNLQNDLMLLPCD